MNIQKFNRMCAEYLEILYSSGEEGVFVVFDDCSMPSIFDPYYDANHRNMLIENLGVDTVLLIDAKVKEWQSCFRGAPDIIIENGKSIAESQVLCINEILSEI